MAMADKLHSSGIEIGAALLPPTPASNIVPALGVIDHVLIFSGNLGHQGGSVADLGLLAKAMELRQHKPELEIGWDGGVSADNVRQLSAAGVDVINVGGFIQYAVDPASAYATLEALA
jgi:pentose-5-phosphate-3-epimerase